MVDSQWSVSAILKRGGFGICCASEKAANALISQRRTAVENGDKFIEFTTALNTKNLTLVSEIVSMSVMNYEQMDQMAVEALQAKKRIEREAEYDSEEN